MHFINLGKLNFIIGQLENFNSLYMGNLEHKLISTATLLTNIDSNVKHLQVNFKVS